MRQKRRERERYRRLHEEAEAYVREQFIKPPTPSELMQLPWKSIALALVLFLAGTAGIVVGSLIMTGYIQAEDWAARGKPFLILGTLLFIPGFYHVRLAYYAWKGYTGYDFDQIPDLE
ncbi:hypothetical protein THASP1DRAFT_33384 [Thamnocephalis sphaerospora]|uniref:Transmembrane protein 230 n=1 Tax=Thamnocephalis sphaerospora TaxID=78915 RepID=A0A4P9XGQ7_9FUNG|nr:hypothetical protein THASP1DRAFT_33384 [Thamnocephalis sphaerospora]|eukprot:RKP04807.1 hypothetical protein THASP1DRAFT_33384 [Thamnocephalis sphaerospora]